MKIAIGSDHAGFNLKEQIKNYLLEKNNTVLDQGTYNTDSVDYPDFALPVCEKVKNEEVDFGILVCYTGIGMSICANKVKKIRAALVCNEESAKLTREHNNANVLCVGAKDINFEEAKKIVDIFLNTSFTYGRHERRVNKITQIEEKYAK